MTSEPRQPEGDRLRVMSFNLRGLKDDVAAAAEVVRTVRPDVLLLQEVPRHPGSGLRIRWFARRCGLRWTGRTRRLSGTGLMTAHRVRSSRSRDRRLPVGLRENPRSYSLARVRTPGGSSATVVSVHLSLRGDQRVHHVRRVLAEIAADPRLPDADALVVGGDLNEGRDGAAWGVLADRLVEVSDDRPTFPARAPRVRIDALFAAGHRSVSTPDLTGLDAGLLARATDHLPVVVDLRL